MTPESTATVMRMSLGTTLGTPAVTGGGYPSDEPSKSQHADEHDGTDGNSETIISCSDVDADLLLHIQYQSNQAETTKISAPILSLRVSSTVLRMASSALRLLLDAPPVSRSRTQSGFHHLIAIHQPRVWGYREGRGVVALILKASIQSEQLRQAALIVFNLLHHNKNYRPTEAPSMLQIAWVAELAWVLDCLGPVVPWIQSWLVGCPAVDADTQLVSALFLAFVMGDRETFEQASLHWVLRGRKSDFDKFEKSSLGIMIVIHDVLQRKQDEVAEGLTSILNESLRTYCGSGDLPVNFDQTFILGAFFSAVCDASNCLTITPYYCNPASHPPFKLKWQIQMYRESLNCLVGKLLEITRKFNAQLQLHPKSSAWENPVLPLAAKMVGLLENLQGLRLDDYRPEVVELMNVKSCLRNVAGESEKELLQLRKYSAPSAVGVWRGICKFLLIFTAIILYIFLAAAAN
ncbi:hypothetical protein EV426DRAFT_601702 [Tirmania nivea]|nr:hypothetical protein EV426DRAFT_601702 [Tirmania nivea]